MKRNKLFITGIIIFSLLFVNYGYAETQRKSVISFLKGSAKIQKKGGSDWTPATLNFSLTQGDRIETSADTKMEIKLDDGSIVRIGPKTTMVLSEYSEDSAQVKSTSVNVFMGRVWANVAKPLKGDAKFKIATPSAIAAVKGTVYRADVSDSTSQINVYDGTVSVQKTDGGESIDITKLEMLIALPATALEKSPFDEKDDEKDEWIRWNKSRDKLRVMIIIPEKRAGEKALSSMAESKMIEKFLQNYLFRVLDQSQVDKIREDAKVKAALGGDNRAAAVAGLEQACDIVIIGESSSQSFSGEMLGGMTSSVGNIVARVIRADTAEILATKSDTGRKLDITPDAAAVKALSDASSKLSDYFVAEIVKGWKKEIKKGATIDIVVSGLKSFKDLSQVELALSKISGLKDIQKLYFVGDRALLNATFVGDTVTLAEKIDEISDIKLNVIGLSAYKIELDVKL